MLVMDHGLVYPAYKHTDTDTGRLVQRKKDVFFSNRSNVKCLPSTVSGNGQHIITINPW